MNQENTQQNNVNINQILEKIKSGKVNMRPKYYFVLRLIALALTMFVTFVFSAVVVSYVIFSIKMSGQVHLLAFGPKGFYHFLLALPWIILVIDIVLIAFLDWLLKGFRFGYNSSALFLLVVTMISITILATLINYTSFHSTLMRQAENKGLPFAGGFYMGLRMSHANRGMFRGEVLSIQSTTTFSILYNDTEDKIIQVFTPYGSDVFSLFLAPGDQVFIAGDKIPSGIRAYGIQKLTNSE